MNANPVMLEISTIEQRTLEHRQATRDAKIKTMNIKIETMAIKIETTELKEQLEQMQKIADDQKAKIRAFEQEMAAREDAAARREAAKCIDKALKEAKEADDKFIEEFFAKAIAEARSEWQAELKDAFPNATTAVSDTMAQMISSAVLSMKHQLKIAEAEIKEAAELRNQQAIAAQIALLQDGLEEVDDQEEKDDDEEIDIDAVDHNDQSQSPPKDNGDDVDVS
jgi:hypothetical protein